ncbi:hypothetical protein EI42_00416 [Thermosporothrix hazakensis]|jgi:DMSO reductase anchor subunit|uniref:Uncharacterized protein n=2 Tax=Thermosporothrix TaxID=768650 RepID=A0A326UUE8_THEHA|nr:hypothetical protein [Thermosporothrix hazakensis]PZW36243.1 hypothetical protein EI42_00416 [Thermosporothrix hazakensis]BBH88706.1 hypothetical protein KTC_34570 [Thermosporothrix sp. COM3]GCE46892.1 hypothetical protein KTH_17610 [Thermosporothrix hazakensis]
MLQLPLVLFIVMAEVTVGSVCVMVFLDWRNEVRRSFLITYAFIYLFLAVLTYLAQQNFASAELLNSFAHLDHAWTGYLSLPLLVFAILLLFYAIFLIADKSAGGDGKEKMEKAAEEAIAEGKTAPAKFSVARLLRYVSGAATIVVGLIAILVMAMVFRPLAASVLSGGVTVAVFFVATFALGGVMTAMWLGHWYLNTPALTEKPLLFATNIVLISLLLQLVLSFFTGPVIASAQKQPQTNNQPTVTASTPAPGEKDPNKIVKPANQPTVAPISVDGMHWLQIAVGFVFPLILGGLTWKLVRDRSFQSATGMLYLVVTLTLAGEIMARGLFLGGL